MLDDYRQVGIELFLVYSNIERWSAEWLATNAVVVTNNSWLLSLVADVATDRLLDLTATNRLLSENEETTGMISRLTLLPF